MRYTLLATANCCCLIVSLVPAAHASITLDPGTILGLNLEGTKVLREYSFGGTLMDTLTITGLTSNATGVAVLGSRVFVSDVAGDIGEVDLTTGVFSFLVNVGGNNEAIGDNGTNLLAYNFLTGTVREYTTTGMLVSTISLVGPRGIRNTGIDATGSRIFVGQFTADGNIREYDAATGNLVNTIATGLPAESVSGLGFDPTNGTFWVSTGFGDERIRQFSATGGLLTNFDPGFSDINGLDVVLAQVTGIVPEPLSVVVWCMLLVLNFNVSTGARSFWLSRRRPVA